MNTTRTIDMSKLKRIKSLEAIQLALNGKWAQAVDVNLKILEYFNDDIEALKRLGKAYIETGDFDNARGTFLKALLFAPYDNVAKKNLDRLSHLSARTGIAKQKKRVTPQLFLEDSGKSAVTILRNPASRQIMAKVAAGDPVMLVAFKGTMMIKSLDGDVLGYLEPKLGSRLLKLLNEGNMYDAAILSPNPAGVTVILRETFKHPSQLEVCSFPYSGRDEYRNFVRDTLLRYDLDSEPEGEIDEDPLPMWTEDGEEIDLIPEHRLVRAAPDGDDDLDD